MNSETLGDVVNRSILGIIDDIHRMNIIDLDTDEAKKARRKAFIEDAGEGHNVLDIPIVQYLVLDAHYLQPLASTLGKTTVDALKQKVTRRHEKKVRSIDEHAQISSRIASGLGALATLGVSLWHFMNLSFAELVLQGIATYYHTKDLAVTGKKDLLSNSRLAALIVGLLTPTKVMFEYAPLEARIQLYERLGIEAYAHPGWKALMFSTVAIPIAVGLAGIARPAIKKTLARRTKELDRYHALLDERKGIPRRIHEGHRRIRHVLREIRNVQRIEGLRYDEHGDALKQFEGMCIDYLERKPSVGRDKIQEAKSRLEFLARGPHIRVKEPEPTGPTRRIELVVEEPERIVHQNTYAFVQTVGIEDETAVRVARTVKLADAESVRNMLRGVLGDDHVAVLQANPALFFLRGFGKGMYLDALHKFLRKRDDTFGKRVPEGYTVERHPTAYSTVEGLQQLEEQLYASEDNGANREETLLQTCRRDGYKEGKLLTAILVHGFKLGSTKPKVGMRYTPFQNITKWTRNALNNGRVANGLDGMFGKLISDGVILDEKTYKTGGGKFSSCYAITPHVNNITGDNIRAYVAFCMYER